MEDDFNAWDWQLVCIESYQLCLEALAYSWANLEAYLVEFV